MNNRGKRLLADVAELSVPERRTVFARTARDLAGSGELADLLRELSAEGRYGLLTALGMAVVAGDRGYLLEQLDSPDTECAGRALSALVRLGVEPDVVLPRLPRLSQRNRRGLWRAIGRTDRQPLADALLPAVRFAFGDAEAARLLPGCSAAVVAESLPELAYAVPNWTRLCRRHIEIVFGQVEAIESGAGPDEWRQWWSRLTKQVSIAVDHDPARLLALAGRAIEYVPIAGLQPVAGILARYDAEAVHRLMVHPSGRGSGLAGPVVVRAMRRLSDERLRQLFEAWPASARQRFLRAVPPSRRAAIATPLLLRPGIAPAAVDAAVLDALPVRERTEVVRELLGRPGGAETPAVADLLTARLPWPDAEPSLARATRSPDADDRARAYPLLVTAAAGTRDPAVIGELLESLARLRNEQDPVRSSALRAVAAIPPSLLRPAHVPALEQLATDALQARDRSYQTSRIVGELAHTLLTRCAHTGDQAFTDSALRIIAGLAEVHHRPDFYGLHRDLPRGAERLLFAALRERLRADADRGKWDLTLALAAGLAHRAHNVPELQQLVLRACTASDDHTVWTAVTLALDHAPTRDTHLDDMLHRDRSLIALPVVQGIVGRRRTDLLDTLLNGSTSGRFVPDRIRAVPLFLSGFDRWSPHQVDHYARVLDGLARSSQASIAERASAVGKLGLLPGSFDRLVRYVDSDDITVAEAALTALGRSDEPDRALSVLSRHVGDDRARVAVPSMASCARAMPADQLGEVLAVLLESPKITAGKEGVRLLATLPAPGATGVITALWHRPGLHRDIRRAIVSVAPWLLHTEGTWAFLESAVTDPDIAGAVIGISPQLLPEPQRRRFAAFVRDLVASPDQRVAVAALDALTRWHRWAPPNTGDVLVDQLTDLTRAGVWQSATRALLSAVTAGAEHAPVIDAVDRLRRNDATFAERDLPARQRLATLVQWLAPVVRNHDVARSIVAPVTDLLVGDPLWHEQVIVLRLAAVRWTEPERTVAAIDSLAAVAVGALIDHPGRRLSERLRHDLHRVPAEHLLPIATGLLARPDPSTALAACALIAACGAQFGWEAPWPGLLAGLRAHPNVDVRRAAHEVFTAPE
ncbi:hypothetical protein NN3_28740 [Nocardia neocaledoniensis NBRC 108232]|uniref:Uncharacterized protein n=1 Tax=Nocardia neocaledoniensis TaxID=236511 RepID=A0A317NEZ4_9NOCA|nr:hypothetical protein [Nocardia neocaledoniensis]PWV72278.1 hypothetical protein DFR69_109195 [Nocardia neocaledoniensis]GEM31867.1 hypothetical protein NN3_28740 [Nocardia neocaledoniensis NBRC 108232]